VGRRSTRYCRLCGAAAPVDGRFCASCGASLNLTSPYARPPVGEEPSSVGLPAATLPPAVLTPSVGGSVRMGFGIACGMLLFFAVVASAAVIGLGLATSTFTWPFAQQGQRFEGVGPADSAPVALEGEYMVEWAAKPTSPQACSIRASLLSPEAAGTEIDLLNLPIEATPEATTGRLRITIAAAPYAIHVESGCSWSIRILRP
jgi:hypothetical protein